MENAWGITEKLNRNVMTENAKEPHQIFITWSLSWNKAQKTATRLPAAPPALLCLKASAQLRAATRTKRLKQST